MREIPIIMGSESIAAILSGQKTQTRRVIRPQPIEDINADGWYPWCWLEPRKHGDGVAAMRDAATFSNAMLPFSPYGQRGDRLYVKEAHRYRHEKGFETTGPYACMDDSCSGCVLCQEEETIIDRESVRYEQNLRIGRELRHDSSGEVVNVTYLHEGRTAEDIANDRRLEHYKKRSPLFMPKWAARIWLEVLAVRVEWLQAMTHRDWVRDFAPSDFAREKALASFVGAEFQREHSQQLWDSINGKRAPWASNPWVWVVEFRALREQIERTGDI